MSTSRITLYTRPGCHLCDDARVVVERVCADLGESFEEVDITPTTTWRTASARTSR